MDFVTAVKTGLGKYVTFDGRARRSEFWFFILFTILLSVVTSAIDAVTGIGILGPIASLAVFLPGLAVSVRRLHDTGRSGWWYLLIFVPVVGLIVLVIWFCAKGTPGANRFGEDPAGNGAVTALPA